MQKCCVQRRTYIVSRPKRPTTRRTARQRKPSPMERTNVSSDTSWESTVGYSRAVRVGPHVHVAGTTATDEQSEIVAPGDPYAQAVRTLENVEWALEEAGASVADVVRTRTYLVDVDHSEAVGRAHREWFGEVRPASTMVEVSRLADPEMLVEIEVDAYAP